MKLPDSFLIHDFFKLFQRTEIAFVLDDIQPYNKALASVRMRCYDIMNHLEEQGYKVELYKPWKKYKVVVFNKTRKDSSVMLAKRLHKKGIPVITEAFCEYLTDPLKKEDWERNNILSIMSCAQEVITYSSSQLQQFSQYHKNTHMIEESVHPKYFQVHKLHEPKSNVTLVYCGYSNNAKDTLIIKDVICQLQKEYACDILFLCEKDPLIEAFPYRYEKYDQRNIHHQLLQGDIMIAPRPMDGIEKLAHTLSKVAHPMAVGLPAVANPVPSYLNTPVVLCDTNEQWYASLKELIRNPQLRQQLGNESSEYIKQHYSIETIGSQYLTILKKYLS